MNFYRQLDLSDRVDVYSTFNGHFRRNESSSQPNLYGIVTSTATDLTRRGLNPFAVHEYLVDNLAEPNVSELENVARKLDRFSYLTRTSAIQDRRIFQAQVIADFIDVLSAIYGSDKKSLADILALRDSLRREFNLGISKKRLPRIKLPHLPAKPEGYKDSRSFDLVFVQETF